MTELNLTEVMIRAHADGSSIDRGYQYYRSGAVQEVVQRGRILTGLVHGSQYTPYQVHIVAGSNDIAQASCSCPYDWGGYCKHIVAVLLQAIHKPDEVKNQPGLAELMANLKEEQLRELILTITADNLTVLEAFERELNWRQAHKHKPKATTAVGAIDMAAIRRTIAADFRQLNTDPDPYGYDYYGDDSLEIDADAIVQPHLETVQQLLNAGDVATAGQLITAVADAWLEGVTEFEEWIFEYNEEHISEVAAEIALSAAEVFLSQTLTDKERKKWQKQVDKWEKRLANFDIAQAVLGYGWDHPALVAALRGANHNQSIWEGDFYDYYGQQLTFVYLRILERQGRTQEYLHLAEAEGEGRHYVEMLAKIGQIDEAVQQASQRLAHPYEYLSFAQVLSSQGAIDAALKIAEQGLDLERESHDKLPLAEWLQKAAAAAERPALELKAAQTVFLNSYTLQSYTAVQKLAGSQWVEIKPKLLAGLKQSHYATPKIDIYLHEKMLDEAMQAASSGYVFDHDIQRVIKATRAIHPDWAIRRAQRKAEEIMDGGQAGAYDTAASWLAMAKEIYEEHGRQETWRAYLKQLMEKHSRKYKLMPLLKELQ